MKLGRKITILDRLVSELKAPQVDPLSSLTAYEREVVDSYWRNTGPAQAYEEATNGTSPISSLYCQSKLPVSIGVKEAQQSYDDARIKLCGAWKRRRKMKGLFNVRS